MEKLLRKRRWIVRRKQMGWSTSEIASHLGISNRTVLRWGEIYRKHGWEGLSIKSKRPHTIHRTPEYMVNKVIELRKQYAWGPDKIAGHLTRKRELISHNTAYRIICRYSLNNPIDRPRKTWGKTRFARNKPNELWQCDWKLTEQDKWMVTYL